MESEPKRDISEILSDPNVVLEAAREAAQDAIDPHKKLGLPMAVSRNGRAVLVAAEELEKMDLP